MGSSVTLGDECTKSTSGYCYISCGARRGGCGRCDWTTCADDTLFVKSILDRMELDFCVDDDRYHATGYSNGGIMAFGAGKELTSRFASIVPGGGTPFVGRWW